MLMLSAGPGAMAFGREGAAAALIMLGSTLDRLLSKTGSWISGGAEDEQIAESSELVGMYGIPAELPGTSASVTAEL